MNTEKSGLYEGMGEEKTYWIDYGNDGAWLTAEEMQKDYQQLLESTESEYQPPSLPQDQKGWPGDKLISSYFLANGFWPTIQWLKTYLTGNNPINDTK